MNKAHKVVITVENGVLQVAAVEGMDKVDIMGLLSIAQFQIAAHGPTGWLASASIEQPASAELRKLLAAQRNGS